jgi:hypothetical protein
VCPECIVGTARFDDHQQFQIVRQMQQTIGVSTTRAGSISAVAG